MPKLGLGAGLVKAASVGGGGVAPTVLFEDGFVGWPTNEAGFTTRQFFSSGVASEVNWGAGSLESVGNGKHLVCYFDCMKDKYPAYDGGGVYGADAIAYGGIYGHALFRRTGNFGNQGYAPDLLSLNGAQDASGWTRFRPYLRAIAPNQTLTVSFDVTLTSPGDLSIANAFRVGLFDSTTVNNATYLNEDNRSLSNVRFGGSGGVGGYRGYMSTFNATKITTLSRTGTSNSLMNAIGTSPNFIWTEKQSSTSSNVLTLDVKHRVTLRVTVVNLNIQVITSISRNFGTASVQTATSVTTDQSPTTYCFDTLGILNNTGASVKIENVLATYDGPSREPFIHEINITGASPGYPYINGLYIRNTPTDTFVFRTPPNPATGETGSVTTIFYGGDGYYIYHPNYGGNLARNTSALGTGTWSAWAPGNISGLTATYRYAY